MTSGKQGYILVVDDQDTKSITGRILPRLLKNVLASGETPNPLKDFFIEHEITKPEHILTANEAFSLP